MNEFSPIAALKLHFCIMETLAPSIDMCTNKKKKKEIATGDAQEFSCHQSSPDEGGEGSINKCDYLFLRISS